MDIFKATQKELKPDVVGDKAYRLTTYANAYIFAFLASLFAGIQFTTKSISCWAPANFKSAWVEYVKDYCYIQKTLWIGHFGNGENIETHKMIGFYQWISFIFLGMSVASVLPMVFWKFVHQLKAPGLASFIKESNLLYSMPIGERKKSVEDFALKLWTTIQIKKDLTKSGRPIFHSSNKVLVFSFLIQKLLSIVVLVLLIFGIERAFNTTDEKSWAVTMFYNMWYGLEWSDSGLFPRVSMCTFTIPGNMGVKNTHTVQCFLLLNAHIEKAALFSWVWLTSTLAYAICDLLKSVFHVVSFADRDFVRSVCIKKRRVSDENVDGFIKYCGMDGIFIIRLISMNSSDVIMVEVIEEMLSLYKDDVARR